MKECLNCTKAYSAKRASSKFCSVNCRVLYHQKHGKSKIKPADLQAMFSAVLTAVNSINARNGQSPATVAAFVPEKPKEIVLTYNELQELIGYATSSTELHKAWKEVERNKELVGWQVRELGKLKELQRTKIDF